MYRRGIRSVYTSRWLNLFIILLLVFLTIGCQPSDKTLDGVEDDSDSLIKNITLEEKIGQLLMPSFRKWNGQAVTTINEEIASIIKNYHIGGIILFEENFDNPSQTKQLIKDFQEQADIPLLIAVDQEGGIVTRIPFIPSMPGNMALGATRDTKLAKDVGTAIGSSLHDLGINVNFAPVLDVNSNPDNPVIGVRSFGDNVDLVTRMGIAYMQGLHEAGVAAVGKHFPGHGDVAADSHYVLPESNKSLSQLKALDLQPFQALINEGLQGMMTAHVVYHQLDSNKAVSEKDGLPIGIPATLSSNIMTDLLRDDMGYKGVLFSDAMNMKAIASHFNPVEAAIMSIEAGVDVILMPEQLDEVYHGLIEAVHSGRLDEKRIDQSLQRIIQLKEAFIFETEEQKARTHMDTDEVKQVEKRVAEASISLVQNNGMLPLEIKDEETIVIIGLDKYSVQRLSEQLESYHTHIKTIVLNRFTNYGGKLTLLQKTSLDDATKVIIVTNTATKEERDINGWQMKTLQQAIDMGLPTVLITARNPYDIDSLQGVDAYIAQYDAGEASFKAVCDVLLGKTEAKGSLPVALPNH